MENNNIYYLLDYDGNFHNVYYISKELQISVTEEEKECCRYTEEEALRAKYILNKKGQTVFQVLVTNRKQMKNRTKFPEDFEREAQKDYIYLLEEEVRLKKEINEEENRLPAKIKAPTKIKEKDEESESNALPFQ